MCVPIISIFEGNHFLIDTSKSIARSERCFSFVLLIFNFHQNIVNHSVVVKCLYNVCVKNQKRFGLEKKYHIQYYGCTILCWNKTRIYKMHSQTGSVQRKKHNRSVYWKFAKILLAGISAELCGRRQSRMQIRACWNIKF